MAASPAAAVPGGLHAANSVSGQRRRLSVQSNDAFVEGLCGAGGVGGLCVSADAFPSKLGAVVVREGGFGSHVSKLFGLSKKGFAPYNPRKKNQDALRMCEDAGTSTQVILVLDGHGEAGHVVSTYYKQRFCDEVFAHATWPDGLEGMRESIRDVLFKLEAELINDAGIDTDFSGSTFVFAAMRDNVLLVANVGDSRVTLARELGGSLKAVPLSLDHKPDGPAEEARILAAGGRVFSVHYDDGVDGPPRVWLGHMDVPGLAMSRSICDVVAHSAGVSTEPDFTEHFLTADDSFFVAATDGLWEFMTDEDVVSRVARMAETVEPKAIVEALVEESSARWMKNESVIDDTTIAIIFLAQYDPKPGSPSTPR